MSGGANINPENENRLKLRHISVIIYLYSYNNFTVHERYKTVGMNSVSLVVLP